MQSSPENDAPLLGELLVQQGLISADQLQVALKEQERTSKKLGTILVELGFLTEKVMALSLQQDDSKLDLLNMSLDATFIQRFPKEMALRHRVLPLSILNNCIRVASEDLRNIAAFDAVRQIYGTELTVIPLSSDKTAINTVIDNVYEHNVQVPELIQQMEDWQQQSLNQNNKKNTVLNVQAEAGPAVRLVEGILLDAIRKGVSDIHWEPDEKFVRVRYRIDGVMQQFTTFHKQFWMPLCLRLKIIAGMNIAQPRIPQDGRITIHNGLREVDMRVASHPTIHGENIVVRVLDREKSIMPLASLGFEQTKVQQMQQMLSKPEGIIVITGPTGSGKTTTLYSLLNNINDIQKNIMTLEEPVEYQLDIIRQTEIHSEAEGAAKFSFADGIRSILRQDPDIILVGESRDEETANMALRAAMTGHQVFTTLHTNDAISAISRFIDLGVSPGILAGNMIAIMAQRLVRRLCINCKIQRHADEYIQSILKQDSYYVAQGCEQCHHTGYRGRVCVSEILTFNDELDDLIAASAPRSQIKQAAKENGFVNMAEDSIDKVRQGVTSMEEIQTRVKL